MRYSLSKIIQIQNYKGNKIHSNLLRELFVFLLMFVNLTRTTHLSLIHIVVPLSKCSRLTFGSIKCHYVHSASQVPIVLQFVHLLFPLKNLIIIQAGKTFTPRFFEFQMKIGNGFSAFFIPLALLF